MSEYQDRGSSTSTTDTVRREGEAVIGQTQRDAQGVVRHAGEQAGEVIDTARREVRDVVGEAASVISREADERTRQAGGALHRLSADLHEMAGGARNESLAADYVDAIANTVDRLAGQLEDGGGRGMVDSIRSTADRRPGSFVAGSALAGFVVGRLIRNGDRPSLTGSDADQTSTPGGVDIDLRGQHQADLRQQHQPEQRPDQLTTVGAGRPGTGSIPPPPPPGVTPEQDR